MKVKVDILRVFVNEEGKFGNPVGVVVDNNRGIISDKRQVLATQIGFSELVFIDNVEKGLVSIYNPKSEVDFAGHALVGTAFFMSKLLNKPVKQLSCRGGRVKIWREKDKIWIKANLEGTPPWKHEQLTNSSEVEKISKTDVEKKEHVMVWAWINKEQGIVRARTFAPDWGIPEDEANGSGCMQLAAKLDQEIVIYHGRGSVINSRPVLGDVVEVGGMVMGDGSRMFDVGEF